MSTDILIARRESPSRSARLSFNRLSDSARIGGDCSHQRIFVQKRGVWLSNSSFPNGIEIVGRAAEWPIVVFLPLNPLHVSFRFTALIFCQTVITIESPVFIDIFNVEIFFPHGGLLLQTE